MTQPVYDADILDRFLDDVAPLGVPVLVGLLPLASHRNAEFLHNEVPGMRVPEPIRERMRKAGSGQKARGEGVAIAREMLARVKVARRRRVHHAAVRPLRSGDRHHLGDRALTAPLVTSAALRPQFGVPGSALCAGRADRARRLQRAFRAGAAVHRCASRARRARRHARARAVDPRRSARRSTRRSRAASRARC